MRRGTRRAPGAGSAEPPAAALRRAADRGRPDLRDDGRRRRGHAVGGARRRDGLLLLRGLRGRSSRRSTSMRGRGVTARDRPCHAHDPAGGHGRGGRRDPAARARHRDARPAPRRRRLPRRRGAGDVDVPEPAPAAAAAARGRGGRRQDRGRQVAGGRARHAADPPPVLRGDRRGGGAVRVELPAPAAEHPPRRLRRLDARARRTCSARTTSSAARSCARSSIPARGPRCC